MKILLLLLLFISPFSLLAQLEEIKMDKGALMEKLEKAIDENSLEDTQELMEILNLILNQHPEVKIVEAYDPSKPEQDYAEYWELEKYFPLTKSVLTVWNDDLKQGNPKSSFVYKVNYDFHIIQDPINRAEASKLQMVPISVVKKMDVLTPQLMEFMDKRKVCPKVMVRFYMDPTTGGDAFRNKKYFRITMHDVQVVFVRNYTPEFKEFSQTKPLWYFEEVGFIAKKITWEDVKTGIKYTWEENK